jgi:hypothetical protein
LGGILLERLWLLSRPRPKFFSGAWLFRGRRLYTLACLGAKTKPRFLKAIVVVEVAAMVCLMHESLIID